MRRSRFCSKKSNKKNSRSRNGNKTRRTRIKRKNKKRRSGTSKKYKGGLLNDISNFTPMKGVGLTKDRSPGNVHRSDLSGENSKSPLSNIGYSLFDMEKIDDKLLHQNTSKRTLLL